MHLLQGKPENCRSECPQAVPSNPFLMVQSGELKEIRRGEVDTFIIMQTKEDEHLG